MFPREHNDLVQSQDIQRIQEGFPISRGHQNPDISNVNTEIMLEFKASSLRPRAQREVLGSANKVPTCLKLF